MNKQNECTEVCLVERITGGEMQNESSFDAALKCKGPIYLKGERV